MTESDGKRASVWATLVKVDDSGNARAVRWETLANLVPTETPGTAAHPAREGRAQEVARAVADTTVTEHRKVRTDWFAQARRDLNNLPLNLTEGIEDRDTRVALRRQFQVQTSARIVELERLTDVQLTDRSWWAESGWWQPLTPARRPRSTRRSFRDEARTPATGG